MSIRPVHADSGDEDGKTRAPLVVGADDDGGIGAKLKFQRVDTLTDWVFDNATSTVYWGATADGTWSSKQDSKNQAEASGELGFVTWFNTLESTSEHLLTAAFSFKGRRGSFETAPGEFTTVDEYLYGPKLIYRFSTQDLNDFLQKHGGDLGERPSFTFGWYRVGGKTSELIQLPDRLRADAFYAQFRFDTPLIPLSRTTQRAVMLAIIAQATKPLDGADRSWGTYVDATISVGTTSSMRPAISFVTGEKDGFHYDRQLLLGLVWDYFGKKLAKPNQ
jgi:hypothetical protein